MKNGMGGTCSTYGERIGAYRILAGKPEGKRPLGKPSRRLDDNIKLDLSGTGMEGMDCVDD